MSQIKTSSETRMKKSLEAFHTDLTKIRTGRAHPSLLEHVVVSYYGNDTPLTQVANVGILDARTLQVTPWEKNIIPAIEKAILQADLGLNPSNNGVAIRIPLPALTEERRKDLFKIVKAEAEKAKVSIRAIRRDANDELKAALKAKEMSEDDERRAQVDVQKITDQYIKEVDQLVAHKERELMEV
jgi:ribosome recycling factor